MWDVLINQTVIIILVDIYHIIYFKYTYFIFQLYFNWAGKTLKKRKLIFPVP